MFSKFLEKVGEGAAGIFDLKLLIQVFTFFCIGILLWGSIHGWVKIEEFVESLSLTTGSLFVIAVLILLQLLAAFTDWITLPFLRLLEGYGKSPFLFRSSKIKWKIEKVKQMNIELDRLSMKGIENLSIKEKLKFNTLEQKLNEYPKEQSAVMPTRIGNVIRAIEEYPDYKYGLDIFVTWPRLWFLLPESMQKEIIAIKKAVNNHIKMMILGILFLGCSYFNLWAIAISLPAVFIGYQLTIKAIKTYGEVLNSAYDLHRFKLYKGLNWKLPLKPKDEKMEGKELTQFLARNIVAANIIFKFHKEK